MTFLNATLIMGVAAIAVPIVLHLMAKREPRKVVFPSIQFLTKRYESTRSRLRVRRWWLLALRIAAVAALAVALARPAIDRSVSVTWLSIGLIVAFGIALLVMASIAAARGLNRSVGYSLAGAAAVALLIGCGWAGYAYTSGPQVAIDDAAPVAMAIVLDNGPSSAWKTADDDRRNRMKEIAKWMVTRLPRTSLVSVIDRSRQPIAFSLDAASAISKIDQVRPLQVAQSLDTRIENAANLLRTSELDNRQIFVVTDLSQSTWTEPIGENGLLRSLAAAPPISVSVFDLGEFDAANRSLSLPRVTDVTPAKGVSVPISVTLGYHDPGATDTDSAELPQRGVQVTAELQMYETDPTLPVIRDGIVQRPKLRNVDRNSVQVSSDRSHELVLTVPPLGIGTHHGRIRLVGDDAMPLDDTRYFSLTVAPSSSVLLVSDDDDAAFAMGLTMTSPLEMDDPAAEFLVQHIAASDLPVVQFDEFDAVVLLDPPRETLRDELLVKYVKQGGGLMICLGPAAGEEPLGVPAVAHLKRRWRVPAPGTFFQLDQPSHPAVAALADVPGGVPWNEYRVNQYWELAPSSRDNDTVLIKFAGTDHPALIQRRFASALDEKAVVDQTHVGRCLIVTTPMPDIGTTRDRWNDLYGNDAWPAFVLVRQMTEFVTGRGAGDAVATVGSPRSISITSRPSTPDALADAETDDTPYRRLQLFPPGSASPVPINVSSGANQVVVRDVPVAGTYWLRGDEPGAGFSVNLPIDPDALKRVDRSRLDLWFGPDNYELASNRDDVELAEAKSTSRIMLASPAMLLALIVFLLEHVLSNRFYPSSRHSGETSETRRGTVAPEQGVRVA